MASPLLAVGVDPIANTTTSQTHVNENDGYAGLKWTLGDGFVPEFVVGYRYASVDSNGGAQGGDVSFVFKLTGDLHLDNLIRPGKLQQNIIQIKQCIREPKNQNQTQAGIGCAARWLAHPASIRY